MRVLLFSNWFPPIISGSAFYTSSTAQALAARGHDVCVVTLDWGPEYAPPNDLPFEIHRLPVWSLPKSNLFFGAKLMGISATPGNYRRLGRLARAHGAEVLHIVNHIFDSTFLITAVGRRLGIPIVGSLTTPIQHGNPWRHWVMEWIDYCTLGPFGARWWDGFVSLDHSAHRYVSRQYNAGDRSRIIPFGVRLETQALYDERTEARAERPTVLFVGHIHPFRNPTQLVRAMPLVLKEVPNARLVLAGRPDLPEPQRVAAELGLSSEYVDFIGETPHDEIVRWMQRAHAFASWATGPYPGLGTAPMEAMLCETPVINDLPEDLFGVGKLRNHENIVLVDSHDPRSIAAAILRLFTEPDYWRRVGQGGRQFVLEHLNWDHIAAQMERFYADLIQRRRA